MQITQGCQNKLATGIIYNLFMIKKVKERKKMSY